MSATKFQVDRVTQRGSYWSPSDPPAFVLSEAEVAWLAALIDGEGTIGIYRAKQPTNVVHGYTYYATIQVSNTCIDLLFKFQDLLGPCVTISDKSRYIKAENNKPIYLAKVQNWAVPAVLEAIQEWLIAKTEQAKTVLAFSKLKGECGWNARNADFESYRRFWLKSKALNKRGL